MPASAFQTEILVALQCEGDAFKNQPAADEQVKLFRTTLLAAMIPRPFCSCNFFERRITHLGAVDWIQLP